MKKGYQLEDDLIFSGSGTSSMEAAVSNVMQPGYKVMCFGSRRFSE